MTINFEVDEKGHKDRNIDHEIKTQKTLEKDLCFKLKSK